MEQLPKELIQTISAFINDKTLAKKMLISKYVFGIFGEDTGWSHRITRRFKIEAEAAVNVCRLHGFDVAEIPMRRVYSILHMLWFIKKNLTSNLRTVKVEHVYVPPIGSSKIIAHANWYGGAIRYYTAISGVRYTQRSGGTVHRKKQKGRGENVGECYAEREIVDLLAKGYTKIERVIDKDIAEMLKRWGLLEVTNEKAVR